MEYGQIDISAMCAVLRIFRLSSSFVLCSQFWPRDTTPHTHTHTLTHTIVLSQWEIKTVTQWKFQKVKEL